MREDPRIGPKGPLGPKGPILTFIALSSPRCHQIANESKIVPIAPILQQWFTRKTQCARHMIPLIPGYAVTIHKAQGMTLEQVIVNLGQQEFCSGLTYTALSRCKSIKNLALVNFPSYIRFRNFQTKPAFKERLNEDTFSRERQRITVKKRKLPY